MLFVIRENSMYNKEWRMEGVCCKRDSHISLGDGKCLLEDRFQSVT